MKRHPILSIILMSGLLLSACRSANQSGLPEIRYGEDVCDQCNMIINEPRFAAAYTTEDGDTRRFDDIGEMFLYARDEGETVRAYWVHDYHDESWVEADAATYVHNPDLMTPMGWGIAAFSSADDAQAYSTEEGGTGMSFSELSDGVLDGDLLPQGMARHEH